MLFTEIVGFVPPPLRACRVAYSMTFLVLPEINFSVVFTVGFIFNEDAQLARHMLSSGLSGFNTHLPKQNCFNFC